MPKVLISDNLSPRAEAVFRGRGVEVDVRPGLAPDQLAEILPAYDGLAIRSATKVTSGLLGAAERLKVIGRAGIGVDNVDIPAATARGIVVMNTPFGNSITTAEHALALMFALARQIPQANASTHGGKWEKNRFMGVELTGKTLGVIGCGNIGSIVAERAQGLRMRVIAYDPFLSAERAVDLGVEKVSLGDLLARADMITLHTPLTDATRNLIDAAALAKCRRGVRIINCARGGLVVEADLKAAIESGQVAGAALDVFETEPVRENALFGMDQVVCTPHLGASTTEAQENVAIQVAEQMSDFLLTGAVANALNMPSLTAEEAPRLRPYMALAEQLGSFAGQITQSGLKAVTLEYQGHVAELNCRPLTSAVLKGLLSPLLEAVNMVSAPVLARERDVSLTETKRVDEGDYHTLIRLTVTTENRSRSVAGSLFGGSKPRIVSIDGMPIEAELSEHMLFLRNADKPGFIGGLGGALGEAAVNIATFHLGRTAPGENAICLVSVDQPIDDVLLRKIQSLPHVISANALKF